MIIRAVSSWLVNHCLLALNNKNISHHHTVRDWRQGVGSFGDDPTRKYTALGALGLLGHTIPEYRVTQKSHYNAGMAFAARVVSELFPTEANSPLVTNMALGSKWLDRGHPAQE